MTHYFIVSNGQESKLSCDDLSPSDRVPKQLELEAGVEEDRHEMLEMIGHNLGVANALLGKVLG